VSDAASVKVDAPDKARSAVSLFRSSAGNLMPRLIHSLPLAVAGWWFVGPLITAAWFGATWGVVFVGLALTDRIKAAKTPKLAAQWGNVLMAVNVFSGGLSAGINALIWSSNHPVARTFAVVSLFISGAYVLLQYYSDRKTFLILLTPYVAAALYIGGMLVAQHNGWTLLFLAGSAVMLVNFFANSRGMLDASRTALRNARAKAREGEAAAADANSAKSAFLATMSHEIRTPLNGVLGMAQAMAADRLSDIQRDRLSVIRESGESLLAILNDILDLSKIEAGKLELEEIEFDLGDLARGAHSAFTALANKKGLSFCLDIDEARGRYMGDPTRLRQILYNLISNALKFTERGEIRVRAQYSGERMTVSVADTGIGISDEGIGKLFSTFGQVDASTTRRFGGTGLGLSICQQLARLMGGQIGVSSIVGEGSTFAVVVPLRRVGEEQSFAPLLPPVDDAPPESLNLRVLAAEDNSVNQLVLKTLLHQIGVEPRIVGDGQEAVEAWETGDWDVILMDVQMPVMDGPTATREIREREAATGRKRTPIIALTANAMSHQVSEYLGCGMDGFVAKPIEAGRLFAALEAAIEPICAEGTDASSAAVG
jgi:signal transduction histidine kinase/CheY-like chemotaxis protein